MVVVILEELQTVALVDLAVVAVTTVAVLEVLRLRGKVILEALVL